MILSKPEAEIAIDTALVRALVAEDHERRWLQRLSPRLPLPVPAIQRAGRRGAGFPWNWSIASWVLGNPALHVWERVQAPSLSGPPTWIHGDRHPGNLIVAEGRISGVIDFSDLSAGDPATDFSVRWMLLGPTSRSTLMAAAGYAHSDPIIMRARGWAMALGLAYIANSADEPRMSALGYSTGERGGRGIRANTQPSLRILKERRQVIPMRLRCED